MRIAIGADHNGFALKTAIVQALEQSGYEVKDCGSYDARAVDYPDIACQVAEVVSRGDAECGILMCGTGIGMSISANKVPGVRAALCHDTLTASRAREHNDANILCLAGSTDSDTARTMLKVFLATGFDGKTANGARHAQRVAKIARLEHQPERAP
ncbi:MAG: ribose 5-phosphate isomerase B [Dehalococcoidia bacterium]|nr:ribose 5-phosphate isomerase B [Dehalococcoidia bacterium]